MHVSRDRMRNASRTLTHASQLADSCCINQASMFVDMPQGDLYGGKADTAMYYILCAARDRLHEHASLHAGQGEVS